MRLTRKPHISPDRGNFTIVQNALWSAEGLSPEAKVIYGFLIGCKKGDNYDPEWIAKKLGLTERKWSRAWSLLKSRNLIEVIRVGSRSWELHINDLSSGGAVLRGPEVQVQKRPPLNKTPSTRRSSNKNEVDKTSGKRPVTPRSRPKRNLRAQRGVKRSPSPSTEEVMDFISAHEGSHKSVFVNAFGTEVIESLLNEQVIREGKYGSVSVIERN